MVSKRNKNLCFIIVFLVLTVLCWCPIGYGSYGEVPLIYGMPSWAFFMLVIGAVLFAIEWVYLFKTDLALYDKDMDAIMDDLRKITPESVIMEDN